MRSEFLPFARPDISEEAIADVVDSIRSGWITTGPKTQRFEKSFGEYVRSPYSMAVNSATAGLHLAMLAFGIGPGDEVITTPMTFAATVNTIVWVGAKPVLADIDPVTLNIDPQNIERVLTPRTRAIVPVHFAGRPCRMDEIESIAHDHGLVLIEDAAHALGAEYRGRRIGTALGDTHAAIFSFHPTKNITTGEGGMLCTGNEEIAEKVSVLRQHGMSKGAWNRYAVTGNPHYDILFPGLKYNMLDIQAAIGNDQLLHLEKFNNRRRQIVDRYRRELGGLDTLTLPGESGKGDIHSWHIFTPLVMIEKTGFSRDEFMARMREKNIGTALHYQAIHLFSYFADNFGWKRGDFPNAEYVSDRIVSLPLFPAMTDDDLAEAIEATREICGRR
ncbi:MAG TPA: DegT/DnrJ/EryC1/StrS aminotransferase family protein [Synergistales bacterium]|jgi:dTDP-4-amino-4,6-dideoxygalactose transaminase|nr:DegT/DnrJ/EryC1/StrS aminotransferase family protein [Synergistales bacterium]HRV71541.1 DegT/DnrJ/EryC1/StrS aminotransferase family protein [Thermovirgaceae bacterium]